MSLDYLADVSVGGEVQNSHFPLCLAGFPVRSEFVPMGARALVGAVVVLAPLRTWPEDGALVHVQTTEGVKTWDYKRLK